MHTKTRSKAKKKVMTIISNEKFFMQPQPYQRQFITTAELPWRQKNRIKKKTQKNIYGSLERVRGENKK